MTFPDLRANEVIQILAVSHAHERRYISQILAEPPRARIRLSSLRCRVTFAGGQCSTKANSWAERSPPAGRTTIKSSAFANCDAASDMAERSNAFKPAFVR